MKKCIILVVLCLCALGGVQAQNAQVAKIRQMYADAKEVMAKKKKAEVPPDETVVTSNYMAPGAGPIKGLVSRASQGLRSPLESRHGSLGAP